MASSYLDLYQNSARLVTPGFQGSSSSVAFDTYNPYAFQGIGSRPPTYVAGKQERVVHDKYNNKYYGTQKQSDLVSGINASIARLEKQLKQGTQTVGNSGWFGQGGGWRSQRLSAQDITDKNNLIKSQQKYLDNINKGMYKQEANTFFDSYDDHTGGWNNVFKRRYDNSVIEAKNVQTTARNEKITKINERNKRKNSDINQGDATKSKAIAAPITPKLEVNTGLASEKTKNRSKANAILVDNGLNI